MPDPRRAGKHVAAVIDEIVSNGGTDVRAYKSRHIHLHFRVGRHEFETTLPCTPRDETHATAYVLRRLRAMIAERLAQALAGEL